jgi:hypothetical protein
LAREAGVGAPPAMSVFLCLLLLAGGVQAGVDVEESEAKEEEEGGGMGVWPFILISIILLLSSGFESIKGYIEHRTPETFEPITDAFFSELATLGFIGAIAFVLTYNFDSSCEGACSVMQRLSMQALGEPMELQENFETLHFLLFAVSVVFIFVVLLLLSMTLAASKGFEGIEKEICEKQASLSRATALARSGKPVAGASSAASITDAADRAAGGSFASLSRRLSGS